MNIVHGGRRWGKTQKMIQLFLDNPENSMLVVINYAERDRLLHEYPVLKDYKDNIISVDDKDKSRAGTKSILIDNADMVLRFLFGKVDYVSMTGGCYKLGEPEWIKEPE